MLVMKTWIIRDETGFRTIFQTYTSQFYIGNSLAGRLDMISEDEAKELIRKTVT